MILLAYCPCLSPKIHLILSVSIAEMRSSLTIVLPFGLFTTLAFPATSSQHEKDLTKLTELDKRTTQDPSALSGSHGEDSSCGNDPLTLGSSPSDSEHTFDDMVQLYRKQRSEFRANTAALAEVVRWREQDSEPFSGL